MSHANATLTPRTRLRLAKLIVDDKWTYAAAAKMFMVAPRTAKKWADRYRSEGPAGMADRSSKPRTSPNRTRPELVERVLSDNGSAYISHDWRKACTNLGITHKRTRPYRPQTNGKIERFHRASSSGRGRSAQGAGSLREPRWARAACSSRAHLPWHLVGSSSATPNLGGTTVRFGPISHGGATKVRGGVSKTFGGGAGGGLGGPAGGALGGGAGGGPGGPAGYRCGYTPGFGILRGGYLNARSPS